MAQNMELQERYSSLVEAKLRATSILAGLFNRRYEGTPTAGAVKVPVRSEAVVNAYDVTNGVAMTAPNTTYETLVCDVDLAVNELIDGFVAEAVPDGMIADRLDSAGYALGNDIDNKLVALLKNEANHTTPTTSETKIVNIILDTLAQARQAKVDPNAMWLVISPSLRAEIKKDDTWIKAADMTDLKNGQIGMLDGVPVFESANLSGKEFILGNNTYCHFVNAWAVPVSVNNLSDGKHIGASAVQGREVCGYKVTKKATVFYYSKA